MHSTMVLEVVFVLVVAAQGIAINKVDDASINKVPANTALAPNSGFVVQNGYEGYILNQPPKPSPPWLVASKIGILKNILLPASTSIMMYGTKALGVILHVLIAIFLGVAATTVICNLTPLCSISLSGPIFKGQLVKDQVAELTRTYMTPENLDLVSQLVKSALDKYSADAQRREVEQPHPSVVGSEGAASQ